MARRGDEPDDELTGLAALLQQMGGGEGERVTISERYQGAYSHLDELDISPEINPADLLTIVRDQYGPGKYKITVYGEGSRYLKSLVVSIAPRGGHRGAADAGEPRGGDDRLDRIERRLEAMANQGNSGSSVVEVAAQMTASMMGAIAPLLATVGQMKASSGTEMVAVLREGLELGRDSRPQESAGDPYAAMFSGLLAELKNANRGAAPAPSAPQLVANPPAPPAPDAPPWLVVCGPHLGVLAQSAAAGEQPAAIADVLTDLLPPAVLDDVLADPDAVELCVSTCPELAPHRAWLGRVLDELSEPEPEPAPAPPDADAPDAGHQEKTA